MKYNIYNAGFLGYEHFPSFNVEGYQFDSLITATVGGSRPYIVPASFFRRSNRNVRLSASMTFSGRQQDSIIFKGGRRGTRYHSRKRKFSEDILILISLLTGRNWTMQTDRNYSLGGLIPSSTGNPISTDPIKLVDDISQIIPVIKDSVWQKKFLNGFHLRALYNHANIFSLEGRFLLNCTLWEWLYARIAGVESNSLLKVIKYLLALYFPGKYNPTAFDNKGDNVLFCLRNQLAHNGNLPIDRPYAAAWVQAIPIDYLITSGIYIPGITDYISFFDRLITVLVFKTIGVDFSMRYEAFGFYGKLEKYLSTGKID